MSQLYWYVGPVLSTPSVVYAFAFAGEKLKATWSMPLPAPSVTVAVSVVLAPTAPFVAGESVPVGWVLSTSTSGVCTEVEELFALSRKFSESW